MSRKENTSWYIINTFIWGYLSPTQTQAQASTHAHNRPRYTQSPTQPLSVCSLNTSLSSTSHALLHQVLDLLPWHVSWNIGRNQLPSRADPSIKYLMIKTQKCMPRFDTTAVPQAKLYHYLHEWHIVINKTATDSVVRTRRHVKKI